MRHLLHDRVDAREALREDAREIAEKVFKAELARALDQTGDPVKAMEMVAALTAAGLADITTKAVKSGFEHAKKRAAMEKES